MIQIKGIAVASIQVAIEPVSALRVRGNFNGSTADRWLQFFNSEVAAAEGAVPLFAAIPLYQTSPFFAEFELGACPFTLGCYACVSSTQGTKTISADTMDITVELDAPLKQAGVTFVGDLTTGVTGLQVWSEASGVTRQKVLSIEVDGSNLTTAAQHVMIFATDTVNTGDVGIFSLPIAIGGVLTGANALRFGEGLMPFSHDTVDRVGCTVKISSTSPKYTAPTGTACIRAKIQNA
jgi:hypothetical protein